MTSEPFLGGDAFFTGETATPGGPSEAGGVTTCIPNTITLDGYTFAVDLRGDDAQWRSGPQDTFRDTIVDRAEASDALFSARGAWARYRYSWHRGMGQTMADMVEGADQFRGDAMDRVDWTSKYQLTLARATSKIKTTTGTGLLLIRSGNYIFFADGTNLYRTSDLSTWTTLTAPGGTIQALATDGSDLYVATSTVMQYYAGTSTTPTAFATPVTGNCTNVAFCSNRLLVAKANVIYEVAATGALTTIKTHFQSAFTWSTIFNIGSRIYIGGYAGARSELYTVTTDSAGALVQSQEAAPFPMGELLRTALSVAGIAILCTSNGVRIADVSGDGTLTYGPLISDSGDIRAATSDGRFVYAGWSAAAEDRSGVLALALDEETAALTPAYGPGVVTVDAGSVVGVARLSGRTLFAVDGEGVYLESTTAWETEGSVSSGKIVFGTVEPKALTEIEVSFAPLDAGQTVTVAVIDENDVMIGGATQTTVAATELTVDLAGEQVRSVSVTITLSGPGTSTPKVYRWRLRGYPVPPPVLQWQIPLIVMEQTIVNIGQGQIQSVRPNDVHTWIEQLWAGKRYTVLRYGERRYLVRVDTFEWRPAKWTSDGAVPQGILVVQLVDA